MKKSVQPWHGWLVVGFMYVLGGWLCFFIYDHAKPPKIMADEPSAYHELDAQNAPQ